MRLLLNRAAMALLALIVLLLAVVLGARAWAEYKRHRVVEVAGAELPRVGCHGAGLEGGRVPGNPPHWPPAARLAPGPGSVMANYPSAASLHTLFRTGLRPDGSRVAVMPVESLSRLNDVEVQALHLYLRRGDAGALRASRP